MSYFPKVKDLLPLNLGSDIVSKNILDQILDDVYYKNFSSVWCSATKQP